ncbi:interferon-induced protein 44 isoform X2 [Myxocyprinus asiaticus]|uniref:interferon-induced protein 44 isoform X2 n=1 Tax=Myxocyprinus asiaticus TaxID=70543 RepID=UPI002223A679|nr:interferon-induced protein 44 isoform X2 [Myxocyprinus asiaticus]
MWLVKKFQKQPPPPSPEYATPWRSVNWREESKENILRTLKNVQPGNSEVNTLRILVHGPVGAGKSSFFDSVNSSVQGRITTRALSHVETDQSRSFTLACKTYKIKKDMTSFFPFTLTDIRGLDRNGRGGIQTDDIIKVLNGHIKDGYFFNPDRPITEDDEKYNRTGCLNEKIHCLVAVLPANNSTIADEDVMRQIREVREAAGRLGIPQAIIMTKVDAACPLVKEDLEKVYTSKKIKKKMEECSLNLGVPVKCIFPVKNYHEEHAVDTKMDVLILDALLNIVNFANDYVEDQVDSD